MRSKKTSARVFMAVVLAILMAGCTSVPVTNPDGTTTTEKKVDWVKLSSYYHEYIAGCIAPIGATAAMIVAPESAPLIACATKEVGVLDNLIAAKASGATLASQVEVVQQAIVDINTAVGQAKQ